MKNKNFPDDFEREHLKDAIYLQEEQELIMQEIMRNENRLPAKIYILGNLPKPKEDEVEHNTLPF